MKMIRIFVDHGRETNVARYLEDADLLNLPIEIVDKNQLTVGDFAIYFGDQPIAIIERKTWRDLKASKFDGREENNKKLVDFRFETGCEIIYILEGKPRSFKRFPLSAAKSHIHHLFLLYKIYPIYTDNEEDTARNIILFCKSYFTLFCEDSTMLEFNAEIVGGKVPKILRKKRVTNTSPQELMLRACGASEASAKLILKSYSVLDLIADENAYDNLKELKFEQTNRKIRITQINKLMRNLRYNKALLIGGIPQVSKAFASQLLEQISFDDLINGVNTDDVRINGKRVTQKIIRIRNAFNSESPH